MNLNKTNHEKTTKIFLTIALLFCVWQFQAQCGSGSNLSDTSFKASCSGPIEGISVNVFSITTSGDVRLRIYDGEAGVVEIGASALHTISTRGEIYIPFASLANITTGGQYTIRNECITFDGYFVGHNIDSYPEGISSGDLFYNAHQKNQPTT
ncbi:hypothetical protein [Aequorivita sp. Q41]|uniref:hypothetical protein n=1 Tax=Aequorivita sp. Q41 TaxID=3153300 RepID=UPI003241F086